MDNKLFQANRLPSYSNKFVRYYSFNDSGTYYEYDYDHDNPNEDTYYKDVGPTYDELRRAQKFFSENLHNSSLVRRLDNAECMSKYGQYFVSGRDDVLLITSDSGASENNTFFWWGSIDNEKWKREWSYDEVDSIGWVYPGSADNAAWLKEHPDRWMQNRHIVTYCLSKVNVPSCKLQFAIQILIAVIICNALKCMVMLSALLRPRDRILVTLGDTVASYLQCRHERCQHTDGSTTGRLRKNYRWRHVAPARYLCTLAICLGGLIATSICLSQGVNWAKRDRSFRSLLDRGFGTLDPATIIGQDALQRGLKGLIEAVLLANTPQLICSIIYVFYNALLTAMLFAAEWHSYYLKKKPLRVSQPTGQQRSTYHLQLPLRYSVPLLVASTTLHWLISQSLFLTRIVVYRDGIPLDAPGDEASQVAFSLLPIVCVIVLGSTLAFVAVILGQRKLPGEMPFVGTDSRKIAEECCRPEMDQHAAYMPVSWGEVDVASNDFANGVDQRRCFTSWGVKAIEPYY